MRSDPGDHELVAPGSLRSVLELMANEPGQWLPLAGGTDVMVLYAAGGLRSRKLVSIWNLPELRGIEEFADEIAIGAGCTYTQLREHAGIAREFPLLALAAACTGGIANQNRGTLGGNIANASPAADSLPALLAYDAELTLASLRGERRIAYRNFHTGYKQTAMKTDELIRSINLKKRFGGYFPYARKVGARRSQAIAKVNIAALGRLAEKSDAGRDAAEIEDVSIALGSVAPVPLRLDNLERALKGRGGNELSMESVRREVAAQIAPIADIRSTARYRTAVAGNLVIEFLDQLFSERPALNAAIERWNKLAFEDAKDSILPCCGSKSWAQAMASRRPFPDAASICEASREIWWSLAPADWMEAFASHPRIGETNAATASKKSAEWSSQEQQGVAQVKNDEALKLALVEGNREYERRFGRIFIVCATSKSPAEILDILQRRLENENQTELRAAADEQEKITQIRLKKWLAE